MTRRSRPCPHCADLRAKARAVRAAEKRVDAADPLCACHGYHRSFCIAPSSDAWWTQERRDELENAQGALAIARHAFDTALGDLAASVQ